MSNTEIEEETTKKENIQLMTTKGLERFTTYAEIQPDITEKPETDETKKTETTNVVTEEYISKATVIPDDIDVITEPSSEEEESSTDEVQKKPRERKLSK